MKTVIIGGVAGGMAAATRLRRLDEDAEIVVFEAGEHVSFANCGLPYVIGGVIKDRAALLSHSPDSFWNRFRIGVHLRHAVTAIDPASSTVTVRDHTTGGDSIHSYDNLVVATGASASRPPELASDRTFTVRTIGDMDAIVAVLENAATRSAVVVGAGYIGLEAAENIRRRGIETTLVQRGQQIFPALDPEMVAPLQDELMAEGITVLTQTRVVSVDPEAAVLDDGTRLPADLIIDATGVTPDVGVAEAAGLQLGPRGGIRVDATHRTSEPNIYAVGDAAEKRDSVTGDATLVTLAGLANRHGRATADAIAGTPEGSVPALGTSIIGVFGVTAAATGWNETRLRAAGRPHRIVHIHPPSHASYYPGASPLAIKLLIEPETDHILGAQVVGRAGVDKRIDVIAVAMSAGITASDLKNLELAYAPQYGSAKDPINLAGYVAENTAAGAVSTVQWHELEALVARGVTVLDVRSVAEFEQGHIPNAVNVPLDEIRERIHEIPTGDIIVHCKVGQRGNTATRLLAHGGRSISNLDGGYLTWRAGTSMTDNATERNARDS